jgi:L-rhamnose-H+ transport protein
VRDANPLLGIFLHALGGLGAGSFYLPLTRVRNWAWESYWLMGGIVFWLACPWLAVALTVPNFLQILTPFSTVLQLALLGVGWGLGNLTFGLSLRYLGISLGTSMSLGYCAFVGTLLPPLRAGTLDDLLRETSGQATLAGVTVCLAGIALCGWAGMSKERELPDALKRAGVHEFSFLKGCGAALVAGILSACFAFGIDIGEGIAEKAVQLETPDLWKNGPTVAVILTGGAAANMAWCIMLNVRHRTTSNYVNAARAPLVHNYLMCVLAGMIAYSEFLFFGMGETQMGKYGFSSWSIHMAFVIVFSNIWGIVLAEWKGTSRWTRTLLVSGLAVLVASTALMGYGSYLKSAEQSLGTIPIIAVRGSMNATFQTIDPGSQEGRSISFRLGG